MALYDAEIVFHSRDRWLAMPEDELNMIEAAEEFSDNQIRRVIGPGVGGQSHLPGTHHRRGGTC